MCENGPDEMSAYKDVWFWFFSTPAIMLRPFPASAVHIGTRIGLRTARLIDETVRFARIQKARDKLLDIVFGLDRVKWAHVARPGPCRTECESPGAGHL